MAWCGVGGHEIGSEAAHAFVGLEDEGDSPYLVGRMGRE